MSLQALVSHGIRPRKRFNIARILVLGFLGILLMGAMLLSLPVASRDGTAVPFFDALFTAASATCVTGLVTVDTALTWSVFGRIVILCLIQVGGLGFMSVTTVFFFITNRKIDLSQRMLLAQSLSLHDRQGILGMLTHVLIGTLAFEGVGTVLLWIRFFPVYGLWKGLGMGLFHAVSAFCNAGFDLMGDVAPFSNMISNAGDPVICTTLMLLVIIGGLGFFVWEDLWRQRRFRSLHLQSKLVLCISAVLILFGWVSFYIAEYGNPATFGTLAFPEALLASLFQSVMPRTAGFYSVDQRSLTGLSRMITMLLMLVGGSAGSTAGGVKNVTAGIVVLSSFRAMMGKKRLAIFGRNIPDEQILSAMSIVVVVLIACFIGTMTIALLQPELPLSGILFEVVSAVATCGLSCGITSSLLPASMLMIIALMFFGRVGFITVAMAVFLRRNRDEKIKYTDTWVMM